MGSKLFLGAIAGFIGAVVVAILIFMFHFAGINIKLISAISELFIQDSLLGTFQAGIAGQIAHLICGSIMGIPILLTLEITGYNYSVLKGASAGAAIWFLMCGILARILNLNIRSNSVDSLSNLFVHIIYGVVTSLIIMHYGCKVKIIKNQDD